MNRPTIRTLGFSLALALASPALVFAANNPEDDEKSGSSLAEQVENGDLITTSGNGENTPASGDAGKDAIPDPLAAQETGKQASPDERSDTLKEDGSEDDEMQMIDSEIARAGADSSIADSTAADAPMDDTLKSESLDARTETVVTDTETATETAGGVAATTSNFETETGTETAMAAPIASTSGFEAPVDTTADAGITSQVKTGLASTTGVDVDTRNGVIVLTGEVASFEEKMRIARAAAMVDGARQVDVSALDITGTAAVAASDEE